MYYVVIMLYTHIYIYIYTYIDILYIDYRQKRSD